MIAKAYTELARDKMGRLSVETRSKVTLMKQNGYPVTTIQKRLLEEDVQVSKVSLFALIKKFNQTKLVNIDLPKKPRSSKCYYRFIDEVMTADNELTSRQLSSRFCATYPEVQVSVSRVFCMLFHRVAMVDHPCGTKSSCGSQAAQSFHR